MVQKMFPFIISLSLIATITNVYTMDSLCEGFLRDVEHNNPLNESLALMTQDKAILHYAYKGKTLLKHLANRYARALVDQRNLEEEMNDDMNEELLDNISNVNSREKRYRDALLSLLKLGKGYEPFEKILPPFMEEIAEFPTHAATMIMIQNEYPILFPELPEHEVLDEQQSDGDDEENDDENSFAVPSRELLVRAFRFQTHLSLLRDENKTLNIHDWTNEQLLEKDISGKNLLRYLAEEWYLQTPKTDDERQGIIRHGSYSYIDPWRLQQRQRHLAERVTFFESLLRRGKDSIPSFILELDDLIDFFNQNEEKYGDHIASFEKIFPGELRKQKERRAIHQRQYEHTSREKVCAYEAADIFYAIVSGDHELTNAFEMIKNKPYLVHACDPTGLSILHAVLLTFQYRLQSEYIYENKFEKSCGLFFDFLLLNGADPRKTCSVTGSNATVTGAYASEQVAVSLDQPSVEDILTKGAQFIPYHLTQAHPKWLSYSSTRLARSTIDFFKERLNDFMTGKTARFEGVQGEWLEDMMPEDYARSSADTPDDSDEEDDDSKSQADQLSQDLLKDADKIHPQQSTWERWKPSLKYFIAGAALGGTAYWIGTRTWGRDPQEELRLARQRARLTQAS